MEARAAALQGARELAWPIVAMTTTLVAVYLPIGFVGGLTGTNSFEIVFDATDVDNIQVSFSVNDTLIISVMGIEYIATSVPENNY